MPTYEYECSKCGRVTEVFHSMKDAPRRKLKKEDNPACRCNAAVTRRIGTGGGIICMGSGFYITDYRSDKYQAAAKADTESSTKPAETNGKDAATAGKKEPAAPAVKSEAAPKKVEKKKPRKSDA